MKVLGFSKADGLIIALDSRERASLRALLPSGDVPKDSYDLTPLLNRLHKHAQFQLQLEQLNKLIGELK